jgi:hypothetical protein
LRIFCDLTPLGSRKIATNASGLRCSHATAVARAALRNEYPRKAAAWAVWRSRLCVNGARMAVATIEHTLNCTVDTFWDKIFLNKEFNEQLYKEILRFPAFTEVKREETGDELRRTIEVTPDVGELPGPIRKVAGDNMSYVEEGVFDKKSRRYRLKIKPNALSDKLFISGEMWAEPAGEGKIRRVFKADVTCKVFGVGGMIEKRIIGDMTKSYDTAAKFTNQYIAEKSL